MNPRAVALTFDDGPHPVWTPLVLDELQKSGARATFFVVAPLAARQPALVHRMREAGHALAPHCSRHLRHDKLDREEILEDAGAALRTLKGLGITADLWRVPWGLVTPDTEEVAGSLGLPLVGWTADTKDWRGETASEMLARTEPLLEPGAIVLMHDGLGPGARRDGCAETVALVGPLLARARSLGLDPVPLDELPPPLPRGNPEPLGGFVERS